MARLYVQEQHNPGDLVRLEDSQAHYLRQVLRLRAGDTVTLIRPDGRQAQVELSALSQAAVEGRVTAVSEACVAPPVHLALYAALLKHKAFDWLVQKTTEVGVGEVLPVITERSVVRPRGEREAGQVERWNRIVQEAGRQCGAPSVPPVHPPLDFPAALADWQRRDVEGLVFAVPLRGEPAAELSRALAPLAGAPALALFIGPEGDFSEAEVRQAVAAGLRPAGLGPRVLRAETAAVVACALCLHELSRAAFGGSCQERNDA